MRFEPAPDNQYLFLDLNSYFASVEQQEHPRLRGKPVIVVPVMSDSTCAIAASHEAKIYGIKTGTPVWEAKQRCPDLILVHACHQKYVAYHQRILNVVETLIPITKVFSIDEFTCRLMKNERTPAAALQLARAIKQAIITEVGSELRCSIGLAPNAYLGKIASDMQKPDGLTVISHATLKAQLAALPLQALPGVGNNMARRLRRAGIYSISALMAISPKQARKAWGGIGGEKLWYRLHGYEIPDTPTTTSNLGHSHILAPDYRNPAKAFLIARRLTIKAASRLRRNGYCCSEVYLSLRLENGTRFANGATLAATNDSFILLDAVNAQWHAWSLAGQRIKKVSVLFAGLCAAHHTPQSDLFAASGSHSRTALWQAADRLNTRYGRDTIVLADMLNLPAAETGTKIAFSRIPDSAEFLE